MMASVTGRTGSKALGGERPVVQWGKRFEYR